MYLYVGFTFVIPTIRSLRGIGEGDPSRPRGNDQRQKSRTIRLSKETAPREEVERSTTEGVAETQKLYVKTYLLLNLPSPPHTPVVPATSEGQESSGDWKQNRRGLTTYPRRTLLGSQSTRLPATLVF